MLEVGFSEILLTLVVALVVLGPEKLPETARTVGRTLGSLKKGFASFQQEFTNPSEPENPKLNTHDEAASHNDPSIKS